MSYTWTNGELITAEKLNATGGGGGSLICTFDNDAGHTVQTFGEMKAAVLSGENVFLMRNGGSDGEKVSAFKQYGFGGEPGSYYVDVEFGIGVFQSENTTATIEELDNEHLIYAD